MNRTLLLVLLLGVLLFAGCYSGNTNKNTTLVVHYYNKIFDLLDHDNQVLCTAKDLTEIKKALSDPSVHGLIARNRVVLRFAGIVNGDSFDLPPELIPAMGELTNHGVMHMDYDYTNK